MHLPCCHITHNLYARMMVTFGHPDIGPITDMIFTGYRVNGWSHLNTGISGLLAIGVTVVAIIAFIMAIGEGMSDITAA